MSLHWICEACFSPYCRLTVGPTGAGPDGVPCPLPSCSALFDATLVRNKLAPIDVLTMEEKAEAANYAAATQHGVKAMLQCPCGGAGTVLESDVGDGVVACPKCGTDYCIECGNFKHEGLCPPPAETLKWLDKKTKRCPKCKTAIEKNHGCALRPASCGPSHIPFSFSLFPLYFFFSFFPSCFCRYFPP